MFNLELPSNPQHYVHRAGRAGRAGEAGVVVTIVEPREAHVINKLGKGLRCDVTRAEVKGGMMVAVEGPSDA